MVTLLKGLLGKNRRPIIVNGRLIKVNKLMLTVCLENYHVVFYTCARGVYTQIPDGEDILLKELSKFNDEFGEIVGKASLNTLNYTEAQADNFTGAIVIEGNAYQTLLGSDVHDSSVQFKPEIKDLIKRFVVRMTMDYFDIYTHLLHRRLMASHMPITIKGHLVAGLFQPMVVSTSNIFCPFNFEEFSWFLNIFSGKILPLETVNASNRHLELSCIAMSDFTDILQIPCLKEFDRKLFIFINLVSLINQFDPESTQDFLSSHIAYVNIIRNDNETTRYFSNQLDSIQRLMTSIRSI